MNPDPTSATRELARAAAELLEAADPAALYVVVVHVPGADPNTSTAHNLADEHEARRFVAEVVGGAEPEPPGAAA